MIHSGQYIDIGTGTKSSVLASTAEFFSKVSLQTWNIKKPIKIYDAYNIPRTEEIIAFCKGGILGLSFSGIVFTDKAIYPNSAPSNTLKRIEYTDLCNYIVSREFDSTNGEYLSNHGGVVLRNNNVEYCIFSGSIIAKNTAAEEIFKVLTAIQKELCDKNPVAKRNMDAMVRDILDAYRDKMRRGETQNITSIALRVLQSNTAYCKESILLLAESKYRLNDKEIYDSYIKSLSINDVDLKRLLNNPDQTFSQKYISDLSNMKLDISTEYLKKVRSNLMRVEKKKRNSEVYYLVSALILLRLNEFDSAQKIIYEAQQKLGYDSIVVADVYRLVYGNNRMLNTYKSITTGQSIPTDLYNVKDGMGLTPLHYKLILGDTDDMEEFLDCSDWSNDFPYIDDEDIVSIYDYSLLASMKHYSKTYRIIEKTDKEIKELTATLENLQNQQQTAAESIKSIEICLWDARRRLKQMKDDNCSYSDICELKDSVADLENSKMKVSRIFSECMDRIPVLRDEIYKKSEIKEHSALENLQRLINSKSPLIKLLLNIYENRDERENLKDILFKGNETHMRVYNCNGYSFLLSDDFEINLPYCSITINEDGTISVETYKQDYPNDATVPTRIYGNSWFSPEAHSDPSVLASEYRNLAKKYHPDVCKEKYANDIFVDISQEYDSVTNNQNK